jgi:hypothetical protein
MYCYCDDGPIPEFIREKIVKGRKAHECLECGEVIEKGEHHHSISGKWEGDVHTVRVCLNCEAIWQEINCEFYEDSCSCRALDALYDIISQAREDGWHEDWCLTREKIFKDD